MALNGPELKVFNNILVLLSHFWWIGDRKVSCCLLFISTTRGKQVHVLYFELLLTLLC